MIYLLFRRRRVDCRERGEDPDALAVKVLLCGGRHRVTMLVTDETKNHSGCLFLHFTTPGRGAPHMTVMIDDDCTHYPAHNGALEPQMLQVLPRCSRHKNGSRSAYDARHGLCFSFTKEVHFSIIYQLSRPHRAQNPRYDTRVGERRTADPSHAQTNAHIPDTWHLAHTHALNTLPDLPDHVSLSRLRAVVSAAALGVALLLPACDVGPRAVAAVRVARVDAGAVVPTVVAVVLARRLVALRPFPLAGAGAGRVVGDVDRAARTAMKPSPAIAAVRRDLGIALGAE